jgi:hypothetical protein
MIRLSNRLALVLGVTALLLSTVSCSSSSDSRALLAEMSADPAAGLSPPDAVMVQDVKAYIDESSGKPVVHREWASEHLSIEDVFQFYRQHVPQFGWHVGTVATSSGNLFFTKHFSNSQAEYVVAPDLSKRNHYAVDILRP